MISKERLEKYAEYDKLVWGEMAKELLQLREKNSRLRYRVNKYDVMKEQNKLLIKDGDNMAQILSDGAMPADEVCCVDYFNARDAVYKHAELMEQLETKI